MIKLSLLWLANILSGRKCHIVLLGSAGNCMHVASKRYTELKSQRAIPLFQVYVEIYGSPVNLSFGQLTMERVC